MTADPTPHVPHVVTVAEHSVYDAVCVSCPWTSEGHLEPSWAEHVAVQHEKGHSAARCEKSPTCEFGPHGDEHPCGRPAEKPGEPCQFCREPVPGPEVNGGACPNCWTPATIANLKAGFAADGISVDIVPQDDSETNEEEGA